MNAKKIKAIRQQLRSHGVDPRDRNYLRLRPSRRVEGTLVLNPECGRAIYHAAASLADSMERLATLEQRGLLSKVIQALGGQS